MSIKISFYGDFTFGENYQAKYDFQNKISMLRKYGYDYLFDNVKHILFGSDYNVVNLETCITNVQNTTLEGKKAVVHWNDPDIAPKLMKKYKMHAVSLGNNHGFDFTEEGLKQTLEALKGEGIKYFGAAMNENDAIKPHIKEFDIDGKKVNLYLFGGYKYREDYDKDFNFYAKGNKPGVNLLIPERVSPIIKQIKENDPDSFIVVFVHFGFDLQKTVPMQKQMAQGFVDSGADAVIGHGPHMINQIDYYKGKPVIYSLGNFIFPADFRGRCSCFNLIATLNLELEGDKLKNTIALYPIHMDSNSKTPKTRLITKDEIPEVVELLCEGDEKIKKSIEVGEDNFGIRFLLNYE